MNLLFKAQPLYIPIIIQIASFVNSIQLLLVHSRFYYSLTVLVCFDSFHNIIRFASAFFQNYCDI